MENKVLPFRLPVPEGRCGVLSYRCEYPSMTCAKQRGHDGQHYNEEGLWVVLFQTVGTVWGFCGSCGQGQTVRLVPCRDDMMAVGELLRIYRNEPVIQQGRHPVFDWREGLKGESTPDRVIVPAVEPVDIRTLIVELRGSAFKDVRGEGELLPELGPAQPIRRGFTCPIPLERRRR